MKARAMSIAVFLLATAIPSCNHQQIVRLEIDGETGEDLRCEGKDWGGSGVPYGYWICYWPDGKVHSIGEYLDGEKVGEWKYYDREEKHSHTEFWERGEIRWSTFADDGEGDAGAPAPEDE